VVPPVQHVGPWLVPQHNPLQHTPWQQWLGQEQHGIGLHTQLKISEVTAIISAMLSGPSGAAGSPESGDGV